MNRLSRFRRRLLGFAVLGLTGFASSCSTDPAAAPEENSPVTLNISSPVLSLNAVDTIATSTLTLSCGCGFLFDSVHYAGDTSFIRFTSRDTLSRARHTQFVSAWFDPKSTPIGSHTAEIEFTVFHTYRGVSYVYIDTIRAVVR